MKRKPKGWDTNPNKPRPYTARVQEAADAKNRRIRFDKISHYLGRMADFDAYSSHFDLLLRARWLPTYTRYANHLYSGQIYMVNNCIIVDDPLSESPPEAALPKPERIGSVYAIFYQDENLPIMVYESGKPGAWYAHEAFGWEGVRESEVWRKTGDVWWTASTFNYEHTMGNYIVAHRPVLMNALRDLWCRDEQPTLMNLRAMEQLTLYGISGVVLDLPVVRLDRL